MCLNVLNVIVMSKKFGTTMGSPVSVTVANLVMEEVEQKEQ